MSLLQMSISAGIMILVVIAIRAFAINRLPKKTFLVLWEIILVRLLIPLSWPSPLSIYSLMNHSSTGYIGKTNIVNILPITPLANNISESNTVLSPYVLVWGIGTTLCTLFFVISYIKCHQEFMTSRLVKNKFTMQWLKEHECKRPITIRQISGISSPLTYGIFRPVILMPENIDWTENNGLQYVLMHEYIHIQRFDAIIKPLFAIVLCIHWFNPLVWVLFILANRDIELSCDEKVIQSFGENIKSAYALALIGMEEKKNGVAPLCNNFNKNAIEERIESIMKMKKPTVMMLLIMILLIGGVTTAFTTSPISRKKEFANSMNESSRLPVTSGKGSRIDGTIVYDIVEVRHYTDGGDPYVFWQRTNNTKQSITEIKFSMLAYDKNGKALNLPWNIIDSSAGYSYDVLCEWKPKNLKSKLQADSNDGLKEGGFSLGWTIDIFEKDTPELREIFGQVAYVLCCDKQIIFENGDVWNNPDYDNWLDTYKGKEVNISVLQDYYPNILKIK